MRDSELIRVALPAWAFSYILTDPLSWMFTKNLGDKG